MDNSRTGFNKQIPGLPPDEQAAFEAMMQSHHAAMLEQQRVMGLRREQQIRAAVAKMVVPAIDGISWRVGPSAGGPEAPEMPILSIVQFALQDDASGCLDDPASIPRQLWRTALEYTNTIPGFESVVWGQSGDDEKTLVCLHQWDNAAAWRIFQRSMGVTAMLPFIDPTVKVYNRCAKLTADGLAQLVKDASVLDVLSVTVDTAQISAVEQRCAFEETWNKLVDLRMPGLLQTTHVWLQHDVPAHISPTPEEVAVATRQTTFMVFLAREKAVDNSSVNRIFVEDLCSRWQSILSSTYHVDGETPPTVSQTTVHLVHDVVSAQQGTSGHSQAVIASTHTLASLFDFEIPRRCSPAITSMTHMEHISHSLNMFHDTIRDARQGRRLFPGPRGYFVAQGELFDGRQVANYTKPFSSEGPWVHVDVAWLRVKRGTLPRKFLLLFQRLADDVSSMAGFVEARWAREVDRDSHVAVLTVWEDQTACHDALPAYRRHLDDFVVSSTGLVSSAHEYQALTLEKPRFPGHTWLECKGQEFLEFTDFHVSPGVLEERLFNHAYQRFTSMMVAQNTTGPLDACHPLPSAGWHKVDGDDPNNGTNWRQFTSVIRWISPAGRQEWLGDLFQKAREPNYELFGCTLDMLKMLAAGGIETRLLAVQPVNRRL